MMFLLTYIRFLLVYRQVECPADKWTYKMGIAIYYERTVLRSSLYFIRGIVDSMRNKNDVLMLYKVLPNYIDALRDETNGGDKSVLSI